MPIASRCRMLSLALVAFAVCTAPGVRAQSTGGGQGEAPAQSADAPQTPQQNPPGPVGGIEQYRLDGASLGRSNVVGRFSLSELYDTNSGYASTSGASQDDGITTLSAGLSLQWLKRGSTLSLDYTAGGLIYNTGTQANSVTQQLSVADTFTRGRWSLLLAENAAYLPNTQFGLGGLGFISNGPTLAGTGGPTAFNPNFQASSSIGSLNEYQFTSTTAVQGHYTINARSSLSASGSVGFLHYFGDNNMLDSRDVIVRVGYDRAVTARDTLNVSYIASILSYSSGLQGFYSQYIQLGYQRILTGRLHLYVSAGPVISHFSASDGQTTVPGGENAVNWSVASVLSYALRKGSVSVSYNRSVTGGSGLLQGALTDTLNGTFSHTFGRVWSTSFNGGYSRNSSLEQTAPMMEVTSVFDYWTAGFSLSRPIGRSGLLSFRYNAQRQTSNTSTCINGQTCGPIALTQTVGVTFNWSTRPHALD